MNLEKVFQYIRFYFNARYVNKIIDTSKLPNRIKLGFEIHLLYIDNRDFLLMVSLDDEFDIDSHLNIKKQMRNLYNLDVIFIYEKLSKYQRQSLIKNRISFVIPNKQMYIHELALSIEEREDRIKTFTNKLSLSAQYVLLYLLVMEKTSISTLKLQVELKINKMYVSRTINELSNHNFISIFIKDGISNIKLSDSKVNIWHKAIKAMQNPIMGTLYIDINCPNYLLSVLTKSGVHELSQISMLQDAEEIYAVESKKWKLLKNEINETYSGNPGAIKIEIWKSKIPMYQNKINPLALYFSLTGQVDERILNEYNSVLSEVLGGKVKW